MPFRRRFRRRFSSGGTTLRWGASVNTLTPLELTAGGTTSFDLTPGAPSAQWQGGTTEPTLLRIRGWWGALPRTPNFVSEDGVREQRIVAWLIAWRAAGQPVLDPMQSVDLANEDVVYSDMAVWDTRDFIIPEAAVPANPFTVNVAGPGIIRFPVDIKAKRRVRGESDRLTLSARARILFTQSTPPTPSGNLDTSAMLYWSLRTLFRTHR